MSRSKGTKERRRAGEWGSVEELLKSPPLPKAASKSPGCRSRSRRHAILFGSNVACDVFGACESLAARHARALHKSDATRRTGIQNDSPAAKVSAVATVQVVDRSLSVQAGRPPRAWQPCLLTPFSGANQADLCIRPLGQGRNRSAIILHVKSKPCWSAGPSHQPCSLSGLLSSALQESPGVQPSFSPEFPTSCHGSARGLNFEVPEGHAAIYVLFCTIWDKLTTLASKDIWKMWGMAYDEARAVANCIDLACIIMLDHFFKTSGLPKPGCKLYLSRLKLVPLPSDLDS
eukprot:6199961-Pleurochrysis_carterae.AAC.1